MSRQSGHGADERKAMSRYELWLFHESQKAWQVGLRKSDREDEKCFWLPKSQCRLVNELASRQRGVWITVDIPLWLAEEKGLCPHRDANEGMQPSADPLVDEGAIDDGLVCDDERPDGDGEFDDSDWESRFGE